MFREKEGEETRAQVSEYLDRHRTPPDVVMPHATSIFSKEGGKAVLEMNYVLLGSDPNPSMAKYLNDQHTKKGLLFTGQHYFLQLLKGITVCQ